MLEECALGIFWDNSNDRRNLSESWAWATPSSRWWMGIINKSCDSQSGHVQETLQRRKLSREKWRKSVPPRAERAPPSRRAAESTWEAHRAPWATQHPAPSCGCSTSWIPCSSSLHLQDVGLIVPTLQMRKMRLRVVGKALHDQRAKR